MGVLLNYHHNPWTFAKHLKSAGGGGCLSGPSLAERAFQPADKRGTGFCIGELAYFLINVEMQAGEIIVPIRLCDT